MIKTATGNPYWDEVQRIPRSTLGWPPGVGDSPALLELPDPPRKTKWTDHRRPAVKRYAWAITSPASLDFVVRYLDGRGLVDVCAGTGYWAAQLTRLGVDVLACDLQPPAEDDNANVWHKRTGQWFPVEQADAASAAAQHSSRALLLCWPPYDQDTAYQALHAYQGDLVFYIGEGEGGCTGDDQFHLLLDTQWEEVDVCDGHVSWEGMHDFLAVYRRRSGG